MRSVDTEEFGSSGGRARVLPRPARPGVRVRSRASKPAEATVWYKFTRVWELYNSVMIPPLVHQRRPCYDFYFL